MQVTVDADDLRRVLYDFEHDEIGWFLTRRHDPDCELCAARQRLRAVLNGR
jgi:hypothetical protein